MKRDLLGAVSSSPASCRSELLQVSEMSSGLCTLLKWFCKGVKALLGKKKKQKGVDKVVMHSQRRSELYGTIVGTFVSFQLNGKMIKMIKSND